MTLFAFKANNENDGMPTTKVTFIQMDPKVVEIPNRAFAGCHFLKRVEFSNEQQLLQTVGDHAFLNCYCLNDFQLFTRKIGTASFASCRGLFSLNLLEGLEVIGAKAFVNCPFSTIRIPSTVTIVEKKAFSNCERLISVEMFEGVQEIGDGAFEWCLDLRNVVIPSTVKNIGTRAFYQCKSLRDKFSDEQDLIQRLRTRFDDLPFHRMCYYQSNNLDVAMKEFKGTYKSQDCLGMTPLHIFTLSKSQNLNMCQKLVEYFPQDLITKDHWGDLPIYYACLSNAPFNVIQYLVQMHLTLFPNVQLNWKKVIHNTVSSHAPIETIKYLLQVKDVHIFPKEKVDWKRMVRDLSETHGSMEVVKCLVQSSLENLLNSLGMFQWQQHISNEICQIPSLSYWENREEHIHLIQSKLHKYELKEITSLLEMILWKNKIEEYKAYESESLRSNCRIHCGVEIVIPNVLPFLGKNGIG